MARLNISINAALHQRLKDAPVHINVSKLCATALEVEVRRLEVLLGIGENGEPVARPKKATRPDGAYRIPPRKPTPSGVWSVNGEPCALIRALLSVSDNSVKED